MDSSSSTPRSGLAPWVAHWQRRDPLTLTQLAMAVLGLDPGNRVLGETDEARASAAMAIAQAVELIRLAVLAGSIPAAARFVEASRVIYGEELLFHLSEVAAWGKANFPATCPWDGNEWADTTERPLKSKERHTLYRIIQALNKNRRFNAAEIARFTVENGHAVDERTIRNHLNAAAACEDETIPVVSEPVDKQETEDSFRAVTRSMVDKQK